MKSIYKISLLFTVILAFSCTKLEDMNVDPKRPLEVPAETLFANAQKNLADQITSTSVNLNVFRLYSQYWTETAYVDETNYNVTIRNIPQNVFMIYYRDILRDFDEAKKLLLEEETVFPEDEIIRSNKLAITDLMMVYSWQRVVDIFGNVPYSEALDINTLNPVYDDAQTIYEDLVERVNTNLNMLDESEGSYGSYDLIYGGDVSSWIKFGNSLKLKLGIHVADVADFDPSPATIVSEALEAGVFENYSESATFQYLSTSPNTNKLYEALVLSGRQDFVPADVLIDALDTLEDPRLDNFAAGNIVDTLEDQTIVPVYIGGVYGTQNTYSTVSHIGDRFFDPTLEGVLLDYTEVQFYLAEAAARGFIGGSAEDYYNEAVRSSIIYWDGTDQEADDYLSQPEVEFTGGDWEERIGVQAWIAYYNRGLLGWTVKRRLDHPDFLVVPPSSEIGEAYPTRFPYPANEQTLNNASYTAAAAAIGGDLQTTRIFWDVD